MARPDVPAIDLGRVAAPAHRHRPARLGEPVGGQHGREAELVAAWRCTSSTGTTAAPVTPRRNDDRSYSLAVGMVEHASGRGSAARAAP